MGSSSLRVRSTRVFITKRVNEFCGRKERERKRAVAKYFDTESGGWDRNSIEGGGFDTIRVARCHKILNGTLGLANLERIVLPLGCRQPRTVATARYRTTRRSN